jgi:hypothetical protein
MDRAEARPARSTSPRAVQKPLRVFIPCTSPELAVVTLRALTGMAEGLSVEEVLTAVRIVPYPLPLDRPDVRRSHLVRQLRTLADPFTIRLRIRLVFARDLISAFRKTLPPASLVLLATKRRWWRTAEERLARALKGDGHRVVLLNSGIGYSLPNFWTVLQRGDQVVKLGTE